MLDNIRIVLIHTSHPGNIGGVARAMKNMGLTKLYLVAPRKFPHEEAIWRAANAQDTLENAIVTETLEEAVADCGLIVGTSARDRRIPWPLLDPREFAKVSLDGGRQRDVALLFGREDRGLTNEELQKCNYHVHIPSNPEYSSLNLASAVQILCYELRMEAIARERENQNANRGVANRSVNQDRVPQWDIELASAQQIELFYEHLEKTLIELNFLDPNNPRQLMTRLRRLYNRINIDQMELNILRGILTATQKIIKLSKN